MSHRTAPVQQVKGAHEEASGWWWTKGITVQCVGNSDGDGGGGAGAGGNDTQGGHPHLKQPECSLHTITGLESAFVEKRLDSREPLRGG